MEPKRYFLTGCASGIGKHMTGVLLKQGARVFATDLNIAGLEECVRSESWPTDRVVARRLDVTDAEDWDEAYVEALAAMGAVDVHMNIAGYLQTGWVHEAPVSEVNRHIDINAKGVAFGTRQASRHMVERGQGHIINIASMAGLVPVPGMALYSAAKYFVRSYTLAAAMELHPHNVYLTAICPFSVKTPLLFRQENFEEAAMMFSQSALTVDDVERAILLALRKKKLEVYLPLVRGWLARFIDLFPASGRWISPFYVNKGKEAQSRMTPREPASAGKS